MALRAVDVLKKLIVLAVVVFLIATIDFVLFQGLSNGGSNMIPKTMDPEFRRTIVDEHRLNDPLIVQYLDYLLHTFTGNFYHSTAVVKWVPIQSFIYPATANTLLLFASITLLSILMACVVSAIWRPRASRLGGRSIVGLSILSSSLFVAALAMMLLLLIVQLNASWPIAGNRAHPWEPRSGFSLGEMLGVGQHAILPVLSGVLACFGLFTLTITSGLRRGRDILAGQANRSNRLKGFWLALASEMPIPRYLLAYSMMSALAVDIIFSYGGLGLLLWRGFFTRDFPVMMATFFIISLIVATSFFILDLAVDALKDGPGAPVKGSMVASTGIRSDTSRTFEQIARGIWSGYKRRTSGIIALIVLLVLALAGLMAPYISTVRDPNQTANYEPTHMDVGWRNPLDPSPVRSPYTGFLHPFGTDNSGRDIYSMTVYGTRTGIATAAVVVVVLAILGLLMGIISMFTAGISGLAKKASGTVLLVAATSVLAVSPFLVLLPLTVNLSLDYWGALVAFCIVFSLWAWMGIAGPVGKLVSESQGDIRSGSASTRAWLTVAAHTLRVTKYGALTGIMTMTLLEFYGIYWLPFGNITWGQIMENAYERSAFVSGDWAGILLPSIAIMLLGSSTFVALHTLERAVEQTAAE